MATTISLAELPGRPCPVAASLELVGERWALLVVREIALGNTSFTGIVRGTGAPRDRIAARLRSLEAAGIVTRVRLGDSRRHTYRLTGAGADLTPVLNALLAWGDRHVVAPADPRRPSGPYRTIAQPRPDTTS